MRLPQFTRKCSCIVPTFIGWITLLTILLTGLGCSLFLINPFLSHTKQVKGEILVVEGWMPDYCLEQAASFMKTGDYELIITTGGPLKDGSYLKEYKTYADLAAATLKSIGVAETLIVTVPAPYSQKDRTYQSALSLKKWMQDSGKSINSFEVCSLGAHTRRSGYLFKKAFGNQVDIGTIAIPNRDYNPVFWFLYSEGVREVIGESIAYVYARLFFFKG